MIKCNPSVGSVSVGSNFEISPFENEWICRRNEFATRIKIRPHRSRSHTQLSENGEENAREAAEFHSWFSCETSNSLVRTLSSFESLIRSRSLSRVGKLSVDVVLSCCSRERVPTFLYLHLSVYKRVWPLMSITIVAVVRFGIVLLRIRFPLWPTLTPHVHPFSHLLANKFPVRVDAAARIFIV